MIGQVEDMSLKTFYSFITGVGAFGVLAFFSWMIIFRGQLVTRREFDSYKSSAERELAAQKKLTDEWKAEADKWEAMAFRSLGNREQIERRDAVITVAVEKAVTKDNGATS